MKVLVTGANGFIGVQVCAALLGRGHGVVALCHRRRDRLDRLVGDGRLQVAAGDVLDGAGLEALCAAHRPDGVCHLAVRPPGDPEAEAARQVNVEGTQRVLEVCRRTGIGRLVYASSMSVYDFLKPAYLPVDEAHPVAPRQAYGEEKWQGEQRCRVLVEAGEMEIPILRFSGVYGPGKRQGAVYHFARAVLRGETVRIETNRRVDLLYVEDAAGAMVAALERAGIAGREVLNIGAGRPVGLDELAMAIGRVAGRTARVECRGAGNEFFLDIARARQVLDFVPRPLEEGLRRYLPWIEARLDDPEYGLAD